MRPALALLAVLTASTAQAAMPADPLKSPMWPDMAHLFGDDAQVSFDERVRVRLPVIAENQRVFPVAVDARGIPGVKRIIVFADLNPIQQALDYRLGEAEAFVETRIKLDQRTPVRGAVQLADGRWLVSGQWVDAAGGGCSLPPISRVKGDWASHLGEVRARAWGEAGGSATLRMSFSHPMDTGFVSNIAPYYLEDFTLTDQDGRALGTVTMQASIAEDPSVTLMPRVAPGGLISLSGRDTAGIGYAATIPVPRASTPSLAAMAAGGGR